MSTTATEIIEHAKEAPPVSREGEQEKLRSTLDTALLLIRAFNIAIPAVLISADAGNVRCEAAKKELLPILAQLLKK